jgi:phosphatidyl-myo-inositol dimannoside synthase
LRLLIVGDGPDRTLLQNLAGDLGIADRVVFAGWVAADGLADYLAAGSLFVGPSKRGYDGTTEGQGLVFAEALAAGLPVVATRLGGIVDVVHHGETGLLVDEGSPAQIAAAIRTLADDPARAGRLASAGRALVKSGFTRTASAESFSAVYGACLTKRYDSKIHRRGDARHMAAR